MDGFDAIDCAGAVGDCEPVLPDGRHVDGEGLGGVDVRCYFCVELATCAEDVESRLYGI